MQHQSNKIKNNGFVLVVVLVLMIFFAAIAQRFSRQLLVAQAFTKNQTQHEQAKWLAWSGVGIALANLFNAENLLHLKEKPEGDLANKKLQQFFAALLPKHNLWQQYNLTSSVDGIDGQIKVCVCAEDGKININNIFDAEKKQIKDEYKKLFANIEVKKNATEQTLLADFLEDFFNKRNWRVLEELSALNLGRDFKIFYTPVKIPNDIKASEVLNSKIAIMDLFTTFGASDGINPLLASNALRQLLRLDAPDYADAEEKKDDFSKLCLELSADWSKNWNQHFSALEKLFLKPDKKDVETETPSIFKANKNMQKLENNEKKGFEIIENLLSLEIEPKFLAVLACGEFKKAKQTVLAIVERIPLSSRAKQSWKERQSFLVPPGYKLVKIYSDIDEN